MQANFKKNLFNLFYFHLSKILWVSNFEDSCVNTISGTGVFSLFVSSLSLIVMLVYTINRLAIWESFNVQLFYFFLMFIIQITFWKNPSNLSWYFYVLLVKLRSDMISLHYYKLFYLKTFFWGGGHCNRKFSSFMYNFRNLYFNLKINYSLIIM